MYMYRSYNVTKVHRISGIILVQPHVFGNERELDQMRIKHDGLMIGSQRSGGL